jgi:heme exporter protein A
MSLRFSYVKLFGKIALSMLPYLKVENLSCFRSDKALFQDLKFDVLPGQNLEILGSNGSGKTTLLRILLGLLKPDAGSIFWLDDQQNYNNYRTFSCFYQGHQLAVKNLLTVEENIQMTKASKNIDIEAISKCISRVGLIDAHEYASNLSVGQRKRISIARWLLDFHKIYFIDEPFSALDDEATQLIQDLILDLNSKGSSFVITGHRPSGIEATHINI